LNRLIFKSEAPVRNRRFTHIYPKPNVTPFILDHRRFSTVGTRYMAYGERGLKVLNKGADSCAGTCTVLYCTAFLNLSLTLVVQL